MNEWWILLLGRLTLACYAGSLSLRLLAGGREVYFRLARLLWTIAWVLLVTHVIVAFDVVHHWSQQSAYDETARQTAETIGVGFGPGLYVNYFVLAIWGADVIRVWRRPAAARWNRVDWAIQWFLAFIMINAAIVFPAPPGRWLGIAALCVVLGAAWGRRRSVPLAE